MPDNTLDYQLKLSDFVPVIGWINYTLRAGNPPSPDLEDNLRKFARGIFLSLYNMIIASAVIISATKGLESLFSE